MEKSNEELLTGIAKLERQNPFPDEIFYRIFEIEDNVERQKYIEALRNEAKVLKRSTEFNNLLKQFQLDYIQRMRQTGNKTAFTDQPLELICAEWSATDMGACLFQVGILAAYYGRQVCLRQYQQNCGRAVSIWH